MKKLFFLALVVALLLGSTTVLAGPPAGVPRGRPDKGTRGLNGPAGNGRGAGKAPLYDSEDYECDVGATDLSDGPYGFVIMNTNGRGDLIVQVSLKGATPEATYDIWVNQDPGACNPGLKLEAALTTNIRGNGNAHVEVAREAGAENFWVSAVEMPYVSGETQVLRSTAVVLD